MSIVAFCGQCGSPLTAAVAVCQTCGAPVPQAGTQAPVPPTPPPVTIGSSANPFACPRCQEVDRTAAVTAIVREATATGQIGGTIVGGSYQFGRYGGPSIGGGLLHASLATQSSVGHLLSAPAPPVLKSPWGFFSGCALIALGLVIAGTVQHPTMLIWALVSAALMAVLIYLKVTEGRKRKAAYAIEVPRWQRAMDRWQALYYCQRCDGVYTPGRPEIYRSTDMMHVLYQP